MHIEQQLLPQNIWDIKCPYSMNPTSLTIHNTANDAPAQNERNYCANNPYLSNGAPNYTSFHYAVDDTKAIQLIPENRNAWHAGDGDGGAGNRSSISIEICYSRSGGPRFIKAEQNGAKLAAKILKAHGWGVNRMFPHQHWSGKYCPHRTLDMGWQRFVNMVQAELNGGSSIPTTPSKPSTSNLYRVRKTWNDAKSQIGAYSSFDNAKAACPTGYRVYDSNGNCVYNPTPPVSNNYEGSTTYAEYGTFYFNVAVQIRTAPADGYETGLCYYPGESVVYHTVILNKNGYNWIVYNRASGGQGYMKVRDLSTGERYGYAE